MHPAAQSPDLLRGAMPVIRALTIGLRATNLYPPEHPALALAIDRLAHAIAEATTEGMLMLAVTPHTIIVAGTPIEPPDVIVAECARVLHDLDILQLSFVGAAPEDALQRLLATLTIERGERRARGGPAAIWAEDGHPTIVVEQIDYQELLERESDSRAARRDALWKSIVHSIVAGRRTFTEAEQRRLLEISADAFAIGELAGDCKSAYTSADGSPLLTTQAATVLAVYRHISSTVTVLEPERGVEVMGNFAVATSSLEPTLAFEVLRMQDDPGAGQPLLASLRQQFDEHQVAMLLARALARAGEATPRLTQILDTMAPDEDRRRRVLRLADKLLTERDFGSQRPLADIRNSLEELVLKYDETKYVSASYRDSMEAATTRAAELAARDLPQELDEWIATLGHENVRALSAQLLIDLLNIESDPQRAADIANDMAVFTQDLILGGGYEEATRVVDTLRAASRKDAIAPDAAVRAVEAIGRSSAIREAVAILGEIEERDAATLGQMLRALGPVTVPALITAFAREEGGLQAARASRILIAMGPAAIAEIGRNIDDRKWWVQRELARSLGVIGTAAAVPPLQTLLRRGDPRVLEAVVPALSSIDDPAAARALHTVLRAVTGTARNTVVQSLVAMRDARAVPMLARILDESDAFGKDFDLVLQTLEAVATFKDDRALKSIGGVAAKRRWLAWGRTRRLRERAVGAMAQIDTAEARRLLATLSQTGDRQLRKFARAAAGGAR